MDTTDHPRQCTCACCRFEGAPGRGRWRREMGVCLGQQDLTRSSSLCSFYGLLIILVCAMGLWWMGIRFM